MATSELGLAASFGLGLAFASLGIVIVYIVMLAPPLVGMDDANIGFRYARNLAEGYGFVFNPGGERVEGVTSLLWVFLLAGIHRAFGPAWIEAGGICLSVLFTGVALAVVLRMLARFPASGRWAGIVWLASLPAFYQWSGLALMDVAIWSAALHVFLALCLRAAQGVDSRAWPLAVGAIGLVLVRPDSTLVLPATVLLFAITFGAGAPYGHRGVGRGDSGRPRPYPGSRGVLRLPTFEHVLHEGVVGSSVQACGGLSLRRWVLRGSSDVSFSRGRHDGPYSGRVTSMVQGGGGSRALLSRERAAPRGAGSGHVRGCRVRVGGRRGR